MIVKCEIKSKMIGIFRLENTENTMKDDEHDCKPEIVIFKIVKWKTLVFKSVKLESYPLLPPQQM